MFVTPPTHLENLGVFYDSMVPTGFQEVLLGKKTPKEVADEWAKLPDRRTAEIYGGTQVTAGNRGSAVWRVKPAALPFHVEAR